HREIGDVVEQTVDREVAPTRVLQRRAERVVVSHQQVLCVFRALRLAAERRDFDEAILKDDMHEPEAAADDAAVAEEAANLGGMRVRRDVEILRLAIHQQIADAAAAEIRAVSAAMQTI